MGWSSALGAEKKRGEKCDVSTGKGLRMLLIQQIRSKRNLTVVSRELQHEVNVFSSNVALYFSATILTCAESR